MKQSKDEMDKWLRKTYGVTLKEVEDSTIDDPIIMELAMQDCDDLEADKLDGMAGRVLDYIAKL